MTTFGDSAAFPAPVLPSLGRPLRLDTLVRLRWMALGGQTLAILLVDLVLGFPTPLVPCLGLIALSAAFNLGLQVRQRRGGAPVTHPALHLAFDCLQLGGMLAFTGGLQNPFALLLLAPVSVSATTLPQRYTIRLALLVAVVTTVISLVHLPLPWHPDTPLVFDRIYVIGIWVSLLCGTVFVATYTNRVAHEARQLADALAATELALSRHEQLTALDGLAAAAAHELATPLSTIALAAKEMRGEKLPQPLLDDIELIIDQSARCRGILAKLRNLGAEDGAGPFAAVTLPDLIAEASQPHEGRGVRIVVSASGEGPAPVLPRNVCVLYGLGNLIENATQFARAEVRVTASWSAGTATVTVADDGAGFPPDLIARLGEPYLTTRARNFEETDGPLPGGLGLGIFIAKTLLERTGARLRFENGSPEGHATITITWPRPALEAAASRKL